MALSGHIHRHSSLKQQNKKHKTLGHRTKGQINAENKGRVSVKNVSKAHKIELGREQRRHQSKQIRLHKRETAINLKRQRGTYYSPPFLVALIPLSPSINPRQVLKILSEVDDSAKTSEQGILHLCCSRLKQRFSFVVPPLHDLYAILDTVKVCDTVLFVWNAGEEISDAADMLLSSLFSQGMPSTVHAIVEEEQMTQKDNKLDDLYKALKANLVLHDHSSKKDHKKVRVLKEVQHEISSRFADVSKSYLLNKQQDIGLIFRQIGAQKQKKVFYRDLRSHLVAEKVMFEGEGSTGTLQIHGYIRGQPLSTNKLVHIPGWGEFQISHIYSIPDPFPLCVGKRSSELSVEQTPYLLEEADPELQETLDTVNEVDPLDDEQTWPTEEELNEAKRNSSTEGKKKKIPPGTSEYQASWFVDSDEEDNEDELDDDKSMMDYALPPSFKNEMEDDETGKGEEEDDDDDDYETMTVTSVGDDYDDKIDYKEEMDIFEKLKAARDDEAFPDEMDTPVDVPARTRFQKYRGLQSFRTSTWAATENLPNDYAKIVNFRNFLHSRKTVLKEDRVGTEPGWYVIVCLKEVPRHLFIDHLKSQSPLVMFSILEKEQKMSVLNVVLKSHPSGHFRFIKSKERLIFHVGFRRFANSPIFSEHSIGDKHKFVRFFHPGQTVVASMFAPVTFPPCPVTVFRERPDGAQDLVATGFVLSADPNRIICKKVVLSGHPMKINRKSATVRYMFFNSEDVLYFKSIELSTKWGRRGHIKEALGTHGHMKCRFNGQLKSQDTILLNLYKRQFPKWKYDPFVNRPPPLFTFKKQLTSSVSEENLSEEDVQPEPQTKRKRVQFFNES